MSLARRLTLPDAVAIGLGAMMGAGVFAVWGPAVDAAGAGLWIALGVAAVVAFCNASSSAWLAATHPVSGGAYAFGRAELGPWWGYAAGWCFVIGKLASCAAMAMTFAAYVAPPPFRSLVAALAVVALTVVTCLGVTRTARATQALVVITILGLALVVIAAGVALPAAAPAPLPDPTAYGVLQGAGLLFFAFAGYARIATMGEEVREPATTIPRAIAISLGGALGAYLLVGGAVALALGGDVTSSASPLADVVAVAGWGPWADTAVRIAAATASLGALLALLGGIGRTTLAMARESDLPRLLARIDPVHRVPRRAQLTAGGIVALVVLLTDLHGVIGFSSFGVLLYYAVANLAAFSRYRSGSLRRRATAAGGAAGCLLLVLTLPPASSAVGVAVLAAGLLLRVVRLRLSAGRRGTPTA